MSCVGNGTGTTPRVYDGLLRHLASHGFVVMAANTPQAYSGAEFYVVEVTDVLGQVIWGGFDARQNPTLRVLPPQTSVRYGSTTVQ